MLCQLGWLAGGKIYKFWLLFVDLLFTEFIYGSFENWLFAILVLIEF
jgi:hypothetical protein